LDDLPGLKTGQGFLELLQPFPGLSGFLKRLFDG